MSTDITTKALGPLEFKDDSKGEVEAVVATLGVIDHDREIIAADAIKDGAKVKLSSYGHDAIFGSAPVGKGVISIEGDKAIFRGKFFLSTTRGKESYETIKALGTDSEWSFGFRVLSDEVPTEEQQKSGARRVLTKLDAFEVSPVIIGAGIGTGTLAVKEADEEAERMKADAEAVAQKELDDALIKTTAEAETLAADILKDAEAAARLANEIAHLKSIKDEAMEEYHRIQRTFKKLGVA